MDTKGGRGDEAFGSGALQHQLRMREIRPSAYDIEVLPSQPRSGDNIVDQLGIQLDGHGVLLTMGAYAIYHPLMPEELDVFVVYVSALSACLIVVTQEANLPFGSHAVFQ